MKNTLEITTPGDRELAMKRVFSAPRALVWEALTTPALLKRWLGVHNGTTIVRYASKDVRDAVLRSPMESGVAAGYVALEQLLAAKQSDGAD